jgi:hypothetical protein
VRAGQFPEPAPGEFPADPVRMGCVQYRDHECCSARLDRVSDIADIDAATAW